MHQHHVHQQCIACSGHTACGVQGHFACTAYLNFAYFNLQCALFNVLCLQVDAVIGADGANSRVAKEIDAGEYDYAIAFQERIRIPDDKMDYYKDLAEMYVGDDVSPDFYGWVFPKYDHVAVGTGTVVNKTAIKQYQQATRDRSKVKPLFYLMLMCSICILPNSPHWQRTVMHAACSACSNKVC